MKKILVALAFLVSFPACARNEKPIIPVPLLTVTKSCQYWTFKPSQDAVYFPFKGWAEKDCVPLTEEERDKKRKDLNLQKMNANVRNLCANNLLPLDFCVLYITYENNF